MRITLPLIPVFLLALAGLVQTLTRAVRAADAPPDPCEQIQRACGEAGFTRDVPGSKDLMSKCFQPTLRGESVPGVPVDPDTVKACQAKSSAKSSHSGRRKRLN
jgi:hypothetical protein